MKSLTLLCVGKTLLTIGDCPRLRVPLGLPDEKCGRRVRFSDLREEEEPDVFISLLTKEETKELKVEKTAYRWKKVGKIYHHHPVAKGCSVPLEDLKMMAEEVCALLQEGKNVHIFCRYGLGRAAMLGVICVLHYRKKPQEVLDYLRCHSDLYLRNTVQLTSIRRYYECYIRR